MNIFVITDLEGVWGVTSIDYMEKDSELYNKACDYLTDELLFVGKEFRKNGADVIYYLDGHGGYGTNIRTERLPDYMVKKDIDGWVEFLKEGKIDFQIDLGSHARAGTIGGFLDHTFNSKENFSYKINGIEQSELSVHALIAGIYNVPSVLCIGDKAATEQAKEYIPEIIGVPVKEAEIRNECVLYDDYKERISKGVSEAVKIYKTVKPYTLEKPYEIELTYYRTDMCEKALSKSRGNVIRKDARTLVKNVDKINAYWDLKY